MVSCGKSRTPDTPWSWVVCLSAAISNFLHYGFSLSYGVFLPVLAEYFKEDKENTAWAGSIAIALTRFSGPLAIIMSNRFGHRITAMASGLLCVVSLVSSSFVNSLIILYLSYGVLFGVGAGVLLNTCLTINHLYFKKNPGLATGIISAGASLGVIVFGPCLQELIQALQWRNTFRVMAGVMLLICILSTTYDPVETSCEINNNADKPDHHSKGSNVKNCLSLFTNSTFTIGMISILLTFLGFYTPAIHLIQFAKDMKIPSRDAARLFIYLGISSTLSRIALGRSIDKAWLTPLQCLQLVSLIIGLSIIFLTFAKEYIHLVIFAVFYGIGNGGFITGVAVFLLTVNGREKGSLSLTMGYMICSIGICGGPPFVGFIANKFGSYIPSFYITGGIVTFAALLPLVLLFSKRSAVYRFDRKVSPARSELPEDGSSVVPMSTGVPRRTDSE